MNSYSRADVLRILRISARQLAGWEKAVLFPVAQQYTFFDLLQLKKLRDLASRKVRPAVIRESLQAMQKHVAGMENPLLEASAFSTRSRRVAFRHSGRAVEPTSGQFVMDFESRQHAPVSTSRKVASIPAAETASDFFIRGVALEEDPATQKEAMAAYLKVIEIDPLHAAAFINLGTLCYNRNEFTRAETYYRKAVEADPRYALAYFDLGNVLDETGRLQEAVRAYKSAISLAPTYADAHYNLALAYEKLKIPRKALVHWRAYVKLDSVGPWSIHAKAQIQRILQEDPLRIVARRRT